MQLVIVESPAKSRTINKYLGKEYKVLASYGHVRDLPAKDGSVRPDENFAMTYELSEDKKKQLKEIADSAKTADAIILATDPDREGEAISWHIVEALREKKAIKKTTPVKRVVFNEITKRAVLEAMQNPRELDMNLVQAQQARRALDYLVGFNLSPVLWRKLPGSRSAGRVQSVALRLICEREGEIERFKSEEYWTVEGLFDAAGKTVGAYLYQYAGKKCEKFDIHNEAAAKAAVAALKQKQFSVASVTPKLVNRRPYAPFTTSTLQQEASRKLGFSAKKTMQIAQKLYEGVEVDGETTGLITYMRTDGVYVANEAIAETRRVIGEEFGQKYVPDSPRMYSSKAKNAQEAHEAIRPTSVARTPDGVKPFLDGDQWKLYTLIWKRMVASQMENAVLDQVTVDIASNDGRDIFRATGSVIKFPGFLRLYREDLDDGKDEDEEKMLPEVAVGQTLPTQSIEAEQHFTEPPPRYSEASLVKRLEELGIGRPSTYASIISVLQEREYVTLDKKRFIPQERGRIVTSFLEKFFSRYVQYDFTADLETALDVISSGEMEWTSVLQDFWSAFKATVDAATDLSPPDILKEIEKALAYHLFPDGKSECPECKKGHLGLKTGKFGAFLGCSEYPECRYSKPIASAGAEGGAGAEAGDYPKILGKDAITGFPVSLRKGPYGVYVQLDNGEKKPKRSAIPKGVPPSDVDLKKAVELLSLPKELGRHPETGMPVLVGIGRFGPYVQHDKNYASIPAGEDIFSIGMNRAVTLLADKKARGRSVTALKELGAHPEDGERVAIFSGRYGPYVKHGKLNASLPKSIEPESMTLAQAVELLEKKKDAPAKGRKGKAPKGKAATAAKKEAEDSPAPAKAPKAGKAKAPARAKGAASKGVSRKKKA